MEKFADFLKHKFCLTFEFRGSTVYVQQDGKDRFKTHLKRNQVVDILPDDDIQAEDRRFVILLAFHIAALTGRKQTVRTKEVINNRKKQCKGEMCWDLLVKTFPEEWNEFQNCKYTPRTTSPPVKHPDLDDKLALIAAMHLIHKDFDSLKTFLQKLAKDKSKDAKNADFTNLLLRILQMSNQFQKQTGSTDDITAQLQNVILDDKWEKDCFLEAMKMFSEKLEEYTDSLKKKE